MSVMSQLNWESGKKVYGFSGTKVLSIQSINCMNLNIHYIIRQIMLNFHCLRIRGSVYKELGTMFTVQWSANKCWLLLSIFLSLISRYSYTSKHIKLFRNTNQKLHICFHITKFTGLEAEWPLYLRKNISTVNIDYTCHRCIYIVIIHYACFKNTLKVKKHI